MIPKIIHYCWFGRNPLPPLALKCINSWNKYFPDYIIKEWNEDNFDVNIVSYTAEAYREKKYAFVSDYARFWILYTYGGVYFDTDVEVIKNMDDLIEHGPFMGCENDVESGTIVSGLGLGCNPGLGLGCNPGLLFYKEMLNLYSNLHFIKNGQIQLKTVVEYTTEKMVTHGLKNTNEIQYVTGIYIYPREYFCPINLVTQKLEITPRTYSIHWYVGSWREVGIGGRIKLIFRKFIPDSWLVYYNKWKNS